MWHLSDTTATCSCNAFNASLDLQRPDGGLRHIIFSHQPLPHASLLEMHVTPTPSRASLELQEAYHRGSDLVARYASQATGVRPQLRWRATPIIAGGQGEAVRLEMLISVHTDRLDTDPAVHIQCRLPAQSCEVLEAPNEPATDVYYPSEARKTVEAGREGTSRALRFHVPNLSLCCGLVFPTADVMGAALAGDSTRGLITSTVSFFGGRLEKGVLRRTELTLLVAPAAAAAAEEDDVLAANWADMMRAPPPLST